MHRQPDYFQSCLAASEISVAAVIEVVNEFARGCSPPQQGWLRHQENAAKTYLSDQARISNFEFWNLESQMQISNI
jgi:hypothetical protein